MATKRMKLLLIAQYLQKESDEEHPKTLQEIMDYLARYDIQADRRTLYEDIDLLNDFGLDIQMIKRKRFCYFMGNREFQLPELKMLIDAVQSAPFLSSKKSMELIRKLSKLTSVEQAKQLNQHIYVYNQARTKNETIYYTVDAISNAIYQNKQIRFLYFDYSVDGERIYRHDGRFYVTNPVALCVDRYYYLVAFDEVSQDYRHYRVDRMEQLEVTSDNRVELPQNFDLGAYSKKVFSMYSGPRMMVQLRFDNKLLNSVIDRFGLDTMMHASTPGHFDLTTDVEIGPTFYGWLFQFGSQVEILSPISLREEYCQLCREVAKHHQ